jgi:hypothetical protein
MQAAGASPDLGRSSECRDLISTRTRRHSVAGRCNPHRRTSVISAAGLLIRSKATRLDPLPSVPVRCPFVSAWADMQAL